MEFDIEKFKQDIEDLRNTLFTRRKATYKDIAKRAEIPHNTLYDIVNSRIKIPNALLFYKICMVTNKTMKDYLITNQTESIKN